MNTSEDAFERVVEHERSWHRGRRFRRARRVLRLHVWIYLITNVVFVGTWVGERLLLDGQHPAWWLPTALGWGAGLLVHAALVHRPWRGRRSERTA